MLNMKDNNNKTYLIFYLNNNKNKTLFWEGYKMGEVNPQELSTTYYFVLKSLINDDKFSARLGFESVTPV